jgi:hypothetical protein
VAQWPFKCVFELSIHLPIFVQYLAEHRRQDTWVDIQITGTAT